MQPRWSDHFRRLLPLGINDLDVKPLTLPAACMEGVHGWPPCAFAVALALVPLQAHAQEVRELCSACCAQRRLLAREPANRDGARSRAGAAAEQASASASRSSFDRCLASAAAREECRSALELRRPRSPPGVRQIPLFSARRFGNEAFEIAIAGRSTRSRLAPGLARADVPPQRTNSAAFPRASRCDHSFDGGRPWSRPRSDRIRATPVRVAIRGFACQQGRLCAQQAEESVAHLLCVGLERNERERYSECARRPAVKRLAMHAAGVSELPRPDHIITQRKEAPEMIRSSWLHSSPPLPVWRRFRLRGRRLHRLRRRSRLSIALGEPCRTRRRRDRRKDRGVARRAAWRSRPGRA